MSDVSGTGMVDGFGRQVVSAGVSLELPATNPCTPHLQRSGSLAWHRAIVTTSVPERLSAAFPQGHLSQGTRRRGLSWRGWLL